jgi:L-glyceraldehyde 3-phosphate reductase
LYAGVSSYSGAQYADAVRICERMGYAPITIHQPAYNMLNRRVEWDLLPQTERFGTGVIPFVPLASGLLTDKYLGGDIPAESRAAQKWGREWLEKNLGPERKAALQELNRLAQARGQSLAQMALAWLLRLPGITSALIGASSVEQVEQNVAALDNLEFSEEELRRIDQLAPRM